MAYTLGNKFQTIQLTVASSHASHAHSAK